MSTVYTFYAGDGISFLNLRFENDVKMYGTQTELTTIFEEFSFENDVKMYGTQTLKELTNKNSKFENDVKMYGTQTSDPISLTSPSLRMM